VMDKYFKVEVLRKTPNPQQLIYMALHQDYSENFVAEELDEIPSETKCGEIAIDKLLKGDRNHWGCFEHPQITFNCGYFPHSVMQQARTHRISVSFDVQSGRYTGKRILDVANGDRAVEEVFYLRPTGFYTDRQGKRYEYTTADRIEDFKLCYKMALIYANKIKDGMSEEHARGLIPFDFRQHFVVSFSLRSLLHFLDLRAKKDAQLEIQQLCELMLPHLKSWCPEIADWYIQNRWGKARLSP
jgi:thymidylate synthase (FAD)